MSQYGDGDYASVWSDRWLTARKTHKCAACEIPIEPGHRYHKTFYVYEGDANEVKRCARCQTIFEHLSKRMRDQTEGEDYEFCDESLSCGHDYEERWCEPPPADIAALAFWLPGDPLPAAAGETKGGDT